MPIEDADESPETMLADVEKTMAANARMLPRAKKEAEMKLGNDPDSRLGLGSFGMKSPVLEHFRRVSDAESQYRLALQREATMGQIGKTAAVAKEE